jgi:radical SAM protein with 4Fe4S-binding SPASM domain
MFVVNLYDGPCQVTSYKALFSQAGIPEDQYLLRDRWYSAERDYGVKLTNRAGVVTIGQQPPVVADMLCHYPAYSMTINWNGDCLLCPQDWHREVVLGNLSQQPLLDIWTSAKAREYRLALAHGRRGLKPCGGCNACGTLHGAGHAEAWTSYYARGAS